MRHQHTQRLDHEAAGVAKADAKFLAKLVPGSASWRSSARAAAASQRASPVPPPKQQQPDPAAADNAAKAPAGDNAAPAPAAPPAPPAAVLVPHHSSPRPAGSAPAGPAASAASTAAAAAAGTQRKQQPNSASCAPSGRARADSPSWLLKAAAASSAQWPSRPGPLHVSDGSLYAAWAATTGGSAAAGRDASMAAATGGSPCRSVSPTMLRSLTASPVAAARALPGSPCGSNYHSSIAAGLAAGVPRAGAISPQHKEWAVEQQQQRRPLSVCREDAQQLSTWVSEQLHELHAQLAHSTSPPQQGVPNQQQQQQQQQQRRSPCPATAKAALTATVSKGRSASPLSGQHEVTAASLVAPAAAGCDPQAQTMQLLQLCQGPDSRLDEASIGQQEAVLAAACAELCRHVSVNCVEQGALMSQLWAAHAALLSAALRASRAARAGEAAAHAATAAAKQEQQLLLQLHENERVALRAISERHAAKADAGQAEFDKLKQQHTNLQGLLERLSGAQQLVQRVLDLEAASQQTVLQQAAMQAQTDSQAALAVEEHAAQRWRARAEAAEALVRDQGARLCVSTPRPRRDLGLLCDLVEPQQQALIEQALIAGVPADSLHRLMLGLSSSRRDLMPWLPLAGSCVPALKAAADPARLRQALHQALLECDAASYERHLAPAQLQLLSQAVHVGTHTAAADLMSLLDGSLGLQLPPPQSGGHVDIGAGLPFLPLAGTLAARFGHDARELGGPVTDALAHAGASTTARVQELEARCKALHREVVLLKCTLAEARKHEQERVEAALRDQKRLIARRDARQPTLLEKFLQTKWGPQFMPLGVAEELPRVLRSTVPVNNKAMPKREAERLCRDIWAAKDEAEAGGAPHVTLAEATASFLERRFFAIPRLVTEVAYNFIHSLGQHSHDADCNVFLRVFSGEVDEGVRQEQLVLQGEVMKMLRLLDVSINHQATGWLHKADVKTALAGFFKAKKVDRLAELLEALDTDEPGEALRYTALFADTGEDLNQGMTAEMIRSQHLTERLEALQDIEDVVRDAAEYASTTSLSPAMLVAGLKKAHRALDEVAIASVLARAFGPGWQEQQHKLALPMGAIMRAIRCGGGVGGTQAAPAMLQLRPGSSTVARAVRQIVPVGHFKQKLASALKVGMTRASGAAAAAPRAAAAAASTNAAPAAGGLRQRRATQEAVNAAVAAALTGDAAAARKAGKPAAIAAALDAADVPAPSAAADGVAQEQQERSDARTPALAEGAAAPQPQPEAAAHAARTASRDSATLALAQARASFKVDVLSAMECVRQSWLKEEGDRFTSSSGSTCAPGSSSWGTGAQPAAGSDAALSSGSRDGARSASACGSGYTMPLIPALRLSEVRHAASPGEDGAVAGSGRSIRSNSFRSSSTAGTCRSSREGSSAGGGSEATTARLESSRSLSGQHSRKPILLQSPASGEAAASSRAPKHVQISTADTVLTFDDSAAISSELEQPAAALDGQQQGLVSPGAGLSMGSRRPPPPWADAPPSPWQQQLELSFKHDTPAAGAPAAAAAADTAAEDAAAGDTNGAKSRLGPSRSVSGNSRSLSGGGAAAAPRPGSAAGGASSSKPKRSKSARHAALLPSLLLTDADDACAAQLASPGLATAHDDVCYTPQAPEEGGRRNAFLFRRLNKGQSLRALERVMLAVAEGRT